MFNAIDIHLHFLSVYVRFLGPDRPIFLQTMAGKKIFLNPFFYFLPTDRPYFSDQKGPETKNQLGFPLRL